MRLRLFAGAAAIAALAGPALSQSSGDVIFNASILDSCTLTISTSGTLASDATGMQLSSENASGARASALIVTTSASYFVSLTPPLAFSTAPVGGNTNVTFNSFYSATGVTTLTDIDDAVASALGLGTTTLTVGATADKSDGAFPAGAYQLPVTVQCAP